MSGVDPGFPAEPWHDVTEPPAATRQPAKRLDGLAMGVAIGDLVLSAIRLAMAAFGIIGLSFIPADDPMRTTAPFEIGTGFALGLTAIAADILLLCRKRLGVTLGWIALGFVALSVLVGLWQATVQFRHTADQAMRAGLIVGAVIAIVIRIGLAGLYAFALVRAHRTLGTSAAAPAPASW